MNITKDDVASYLGSILEKPLHKRTDDNYEEDTSYHPVKSLIAALQYKYPTCQFSNIFVYGNKPASIEYRNATKCNVDEAELMLVDIYHKESAEYLYTEIYIYEK